MRAAKREPRRQQHRQRAQHSAESPPLSRAIRSCARPCPPSLLLSSCDTVLVTARVPDCRCEASVHAHRRDSEGRGQSHVHCSAELVRMSSAHAMPRLCRPLAAPSSAVKKTLLRARPQPSLLCRFDPIALFPSNPHPCQAWNSAIVT